MRTTSRGNPRARLLVALMTCLMLLSLPVAPAAADPPVTVTFTYTGAVQNWTVPANVTAITLEAWGAQGGNSSLVTGAKGGYAKGRIPVTPGEVLNVYVGGQGSSYDSSASFGSLVGGGWNGGGDTSNGTYSGTTGAGGGGASDVRRGGTALTDRKVVGGGGGGAGGGVSTATGSGGGGGGGYFGGGAGGSGGITSDTVTSATGGLGGTQAAGGAGGAGVSSTSGSGTLGQGGDSGTQTGPHTASGMGAPGAGGAGGGLSGSNGANGASNNTKKPGAGGGGGSSSVSGTDTQTLADQRSGNGEIKFTLWATEPPLTPVQITPIEGHAFSGPGAQTFTVNAVDTDGDAYTATIELRSTAGALVQTLTTPSTASGSNASASASPNLAVGSYKWRAKACQTTIPTSCSAFTADRAFSVGDNDAPAAPEIVYPQENMVFQPGQRQDFTLKTTDPDSDPYTGKIKFRQMDGNYANREVDTHPAPSGAASSGTLGTNGLVPGTYTMEATAIDTHDATSPKTEQQIGVADLTGSPCTAAGTLVDGWFGDRYLQVSTATVGDVGFVCVSTAQAGQEVGKFSGWLRAEANGGTYGGGTPTVGTTASCDEDADGLLPFPLLDQTVGPPAAQVSVWGGLLNTGASVTACLKLKAGTSTLLDHAVTIAAPDGAQLSDLNFVPAAPTWTPPLEVAPPAGLPSSECYQAPVGRQRFVNATVDGQHIWLYSQSAADTTRLCARIQGTTSNGVVLRQQSGPTGQPVTWQVGLPVDHASSPCDPDWQWYMSNEPYHARLRTSAPGDDPLGVCLSAGEDGPALAVWLAMDLSPGTPVTTYQVDS